jgi:hypothetical protein
VVVVVVRRWLQQAETSAFPVTIENIVGAQGPPLRLGIAAEQRG